MDDIRSLYLANFISGLGNWITSLVIFGWVWKVTGSASWMGLGILCHRLPMIFGVTFFAKQAEGSPRLLHIRNDFRRAIILLAMIFVIYGHGRMHPVPAGSASWSWVFVFLLLSAARSFLSGADGPCQAKMVANIQGKELAPSSQQILQILFGLNGFIAASIFVLGLLKGNYTEILAFDLCTFLASGILLTRMGFSQQGTPLGASPGADGGLVEALRSSPAVWYLMLVHGIRIFGLTVAFQQLLLLPQINFGLGKESGGYMYMILTLAWFSSGQLVKHLGIKLSPMTYSSASAGVCLLAPFAWIAHSMIWAFSLTAVVWFVDGVLLACMADDLQRRSSASFTSRIFGAYGITTNLSVAVGSVVLGFLADIVGNFKGAICVGGLSSLALVLLGFARRKVEQA